MERLTEVMTCPDGTKLYDISNKLAGLNVNRAVKTRMILEKLAAYEDAEEQRLILKLPCKVGDPLYRINKGAREPVIMMHIIQLCIKKLSKDRIVIRIDTIDDNGGSDNYYFQFDIGKKIFLTREEAEAKLKEMEGRAQ